MSESLMGKGDRITIERYGSKSARSGRIIEVVGEGARVRYHVRWDDGRESTIYPHQIERSPSRDSGQQPSAPRHPRRTRRAEQPQPAMTAIPGDRLVVHGHALGRPGRDAEILDVRGSGGGPPFLVRWSDTGRETLVYPGPDATVESLARQQQRRSGSRR